MTGEKYNGWKNRQTWLAKLWIDNTYDIYQKSLEITEAFGRERFGDLAVALKSLLDVYIPNLVDDLPLSERHLIDWKEIAEDCLIDLEESGGEREEDESAEDYERRMAAIRSKYVGDGKDYGAYMKSLGIEVDK